jgi:3-methyl-2-oxobutanoate hydroxymethyltransferase
MGHIGLTPQSILSVGGWRVQGRDRARAQQLLDDAQALQDAGAFAIVLELVPAPLARRISDTLDIPTIGIGAGPECDGQIQVMHDILGYASPGDHIPKHAKQYANLGAIIAEAVGHYVAEVRAGAFPTEAQSFTMEESVLAALGEPEPAESGQADAAGQNGARSQLPAAGQAGGAHGAAGPVQPPSPAREAK